MKKNTKIEKNTVWKQLVSNITNKMTPDRLIESRKKLKQNNNIEFSPPKADQQIQFIKTFK